MIRVRQSLIFLIYVASFEAGEQQISILWVKLLRIEPKIYRMHSERANRRKNFAILHTDNKQK